MITNNKENKETPQKSNVPRERIQHDLERKMSNSAKGRQEKRKARRVHAKGERVVEGEDL